MGETGLFWKKMPSRLYIMKDESKAPGFKEQKNRVMLLMCGNVASFMIKPEFIYKFVKPRAFKNKNKSLLPAHGMHNPMSGLQKV